MFFQSEPETDNPWHLKACNNIKRVYEFMNILVGTLKVRKGQQLDPPLMYVCLYVCTYARTLIGLYTEQENFHLGPRHIIKPIIVHRRKINYFFVIGIWTHETK